MDSEGSSKRILLETEKKQREREKRKKNRTGSLEILAAAGGWR